MSIGSIVPKLHCVVEFITPEMAMKYLEVNIANRKLSMVRVGAMARDIKTGNWKLTHQGIAFDVDGFLIDGQHRLHAIIAAGIGVWMVVARQLAGDSKLVVDMGIIRKPAHSMSISRGYTVPDQHIAIIKAATAFSAGSYYDKKLTTSEVNTLYDQFVNALAWVDSVFPSWMEKGTTSATVKAAAALAWFYVPDLERLGAFVATVTGKRLGEGRGDSAAMLFREVMLKHGTKNETDRREAFKKAQRAIELFLSNTTVKRLSGGSVVYPWPLDGAVRS
jgi:hypothetical protein